jgi:hypothetical protein
LIPAQSAIAELEGERNDQAQCMVDDSDGTFASLQDAGTVNLFIFNEFDVENAEITYVTAKVEARTEEELAANETRE